MDGCMNEWRDDGFEGEEGETVHCARRYPSSTTRRKNNKYVAVKNVEDLDDFPVGDVF